MTTINCDMGESFGLYRLGADELLMPLVDLANVACGFHASDFNHMRATVRLAKQHGVKVGAHPSFPDLQGFGRREMTIARDELANAIIYQVGALNGFLEAEGLALNHIKPHGALYGMAMSHDDTAHAICDTADVFRVPILGMANTAQERVYAARGHTLIAEYYADLDYDAAGRIVITRSRGPVDVPDRTARALRAVRDGKVATLGGGDAPVGADTICIHSDTPNATALAHSLRAGLSALTGRAATS